MSEKRRMEDWEIDQTVLHLQEERRGEPTVERTLLKMRDAALVRRLRKGQSVEDISKAQMNRIWVAMGAMGFWFISDFALTVLSSLFGAAAALRAYDAVISAVGVGAFTLMVLAWMENRLRKRRKPEPEAITRTVNYHWNVEPASREKVVEPTIRTLVEIALERHPDVKLESGRSDEGDLGCITFGLTGREPDIEALVEDWKTWFNKSMHGNGGIE